MESFQEPEVSLEKALSDLPFVKAGSQNNVYNKKPTEYVALHYRLDSRTPLTQNIARANNINDLKIYKEVVKSKHEGHNMKYNELSERLKTHKHQDKFLDRYKALDYNRPSHTIVAHIAKDGHHYIHPDIDQNRSITLREAARIQGFSDDFYFENSRTAAFIQIGNAVPPIFSEKIAKAIRELNLT
ncbi:C-5 cytosine-specific DNA methylase [Leuconostocaceae bacterium R-53105]|uniref:DNA (cytosine-5-)-methyltransferase n=1 Tax=Convivina intestini TaxID=1505726 RepID=A0A2U1DFC4_9LACO|nr:C-5 cytosine-specific DNA methylase [Convivina intestini]CAH1851123.1 hypothetical protein R077811_00229 [Convivina intestini]SDB82034.1 C-5 cytosine-specific DNA methylase [Leuconostocaceae bacterium R-53105]